MGKNNQRKDKSAFDRAILVSVEKLRLVRYADEKLRDALDQKISLMEGDGYEMTYGDQAPDRIALMKALLDARYLLAKLALPVVP